MALNPLAIAARLHFLQLRTMCGVPAVYRRGALQSGSIMVVPGNRVVNRETADGVYFQGREDDVLILAEELIVDTDPIEPERYDEIDLYDPDTDEINRQLRIAVDEAFDHSDPYGLIFRIHLMEF